MSERLRQTTPPGPAAPTEPAAAPEAASDQDQGRAGWTREDDELLLLDEIEETPDDERIEDLV